MRPPQIPLTRGRRDIDICLSRVGVIRLVVGFLASPFSMNDCMYIEEAQIFELSFRASAGWWEHCNTQRAGRDRLGREREQER